MFPAACFCFPFTLIDVQTSAAVDEIKFYLDCISAELMGGKKQMIDD